MNEELNKYIAEARKLHMDDAAIRANLISAGWLSSDIALVLPEESLEIPKPSVSVFRELFMYIVSVLLPPFGLIWAFKYLRGRTRQGRRIAVIIIAVTVIFLIINILLILALYNKYFELLNSFSDISY